MSQSTSPESTIEETPINPPVNRPIKGNPQTSSTPKKQHNNKPNSKAPGTQSKPTGHPTPGAYVYHPPQPVDVYNRYAPLDNGAPHPYYYEPYHHPYPPRPPRGGFRGNFRGRPGPYYI